VSHDGDDPPPGAEEELDELGEAGAVPAVDGVPATVLGVRCAPVGRWVAGPELQAAVAIATRARVTAATGAAKRGGVTGRVLPPSGSGRARTGVGVMDCGS
jgi:hypothetical protein